jgi:hypothetical protein
MIKKLFVSVVAAGALTVPLAGVAWADPPSGGDPNGNGQGIGPGGIPSQVTPRHSPGSEIKVLAQQPGSTPDAIDSLPGFDREGPGQRIKDFTPGAGQPGP